MTKLGKFCFYTPLRVAGLSIIISYIIMILSQKESASDFRHSCDMSGMIYGFVIFSNIIISLLSYTIALNFYKCIRNNILLSSVTFYLPTIILFICFYTLDISSYSIVLYSLPFLISQIYYFIRFHKRLKSGEILEDYYE